MPALLRKPAAQESPGERARPFASPRVSTVSRLPSEYAGLPSNQEATIARLAKNQMRVATNRAGVLTFAQQLAIPWPQTTDLLTRYASFCGEKLPDPNGAFPSLVVATISNIAIAMEQPLFIGDYKGVIPSSPKTFAEFCRVLLSNAQHVADYIAVVRDPPGAKPKGGEGAQSFMWQWWKRDFLVWQHGARFGIDFERARSKQLPEPGSAEDVPTRSIAPDIHPMLEAIGTAFQLESWAWRLLIPRLMYDDEIRLLASFLQPPVRRQELEEML